MTGEVTIRETLESDWPTLFENQRDPASSAMAGVPAREWDAYIAHQRKVRADEANLTWTILYDGQIAGDVLSFPRDGRREIGYRIAQQYWGNGIATRALALFLDRRAAASPLWPHHQQQHRLAPRAGEMRLHGHRRGTRGRRTRHHLHVRRRCSQRYAVIAAYSCINSSSFVVVRQLRAVLVTPSFVSK